MFSSAKLATLFVACCALAFSIASTPPSFSLAFLEDLTERASNLTISIDGSCGGTSQVTCQGSSFGNCCSRLGYCGTNSSYCGSGCQKSFGTCGNTAQSSDGSCGGSAGTSCQGSDFGNCCSELGYCGANSSYCGAGCQSQFGTCFPSSSSNSTTATLTTTSSVSSTSPSSSSTSSSATTAAATAASATSTSGVSSSSQSSSLSGGAIAGIVMGTLAGLAILIALLWLFWRRRSSTKKGDVTDGSELGADKYDKPYTYAGPPQEMGTAENIQELPATRAEKIGQSLVDERVAAGYDGAYRGN